MELILDVWPLVIVSGVLLAFDIIGYYRCLEAWAIGENNASR